MCTRANNLSPSHYLFQTYQPLSLLSLYGTSYSICSFTYMPHGVCRARGSFIIFSIASAWFALGIYNQRIIEKGPD